MCCGAGLIQYMTVYHNLLLNRDGAQEIYIDDDFGFRYVMRIIVGLLGGVHIVYVASGRANH